MLVLASTTTETDETDTLKASIRLKFKDLTN